MFKSKTQVKINLKYEKDYVLAEESFMALPKAPLGAVRAYGLLRSRSPPKHGHAEAYQEGRPIKKAARKVQNDEKALKLHGNTYLKTELREILEPNPWKLEENISGVEVEGDLP